jgi:hypothetical protein
MRIATIRGQHVMFDADLAELYGVSTKVLVQAAKRNRSRFPNDFMFRLTALEFQDLRSQIVTSSSWGGRRTAPYAFTEQGVAMLSGFFEARKPSRPISKSCGRLCALAPTRHFACRLSQEA